MFESLLSILTLLAMFLAAYGLGWPLVRALRLNCDDACDSFAWSTALGLCAAGGTLMLLGFAGLLYREAIGVGTVALAFWGAGKVLQDIMNRPPTVLRALARVEDAACGEQVAPPPRIIRRAILLACLVAAAASAVSALAPPTAGDALCYHLELPKRFLQEHGFVFLPDHDNSTYPLFVEMWYLWALALDGGVAAQLVHWALGLGLALATTLLARPILGHVWAASAGALVLLTPGISNQMTAPLNDVGLALLTTLALAAWWRAAIDDGGPRWYIPAGVLLGAAWGTKYLALLFTAAWFLAWAVIVWRRREHAHTWWNGAVTMLVLAVGVAGPWYARAAWHRGNPVYPFFQGIVDHNAAPTIRASKLPIARTPAGLASAPWRVTMQPERFGGRGHQLGCAYLMLLPGVLVARRLRGVRLLMGIAALYVAGWFVLRQNVRFLFPLIPLAAVPCVWVLIEMRRWARWPAFIASAPVAGMLLLGTIWPIHRARDHWTVACGLERREAYLERSEPTYRAALLANALSGRGADILSQDNRTYYFQARMTQEPLFRARTGYDRADLPVAERLRRAGYEYLLLADLDLPGEQPKGRSLWQQVDAAIVQSGRRDLRLLLDYTCRDTDGADRSYRLVQINPTHDRMEAASLPEAARRR